MIRALSAALGLAAASRAARADTLALDLTATDSFDRSASTGLWNIAQGRIQAAVAPQGTAGSELDFGTGADGAFSDGPAQTGITVTSSTVTVNTDTKADFSFRSFNLSAGHTLAVTGSHPLVIRVLGATTVAGTISLDGGNGTVNGTPGLGNETVGLIAGGTGVGGGGSGGHGGQTNNTAPGAGLPASGPSRGGSAATNQNGTANDNGGGGGCNGSGAVDGSNGGGTAGSCAAQATIAGNFDTTLAGGSGGGGGGACVGGSCTANVGGGGGGAGGGAIRILSVGNIAVSGSISAKGGDGGKNNADNGGLADCGGGGGGGSGGSVWLQSAGTVSGAGTVNVSKGLGGVAATGTTCDGAGYDGGNGSDGVYRADGTATLGAPNLNRTVVSPSGQTYVVATRASDFSGGFFSLSSASETIGCGTDGPTPEIRYEGSNDGVTWEKSVLKADLAQLANYPYIRIKVSITTTGPNPPCVTALSVEYGRSNLPDLSLQGSPFLCGTLGGPGGAGPGRRSGDRAPPLTRAGDLAVLLAALLLARGGWPARRAVHPRAG